MTTPAKPGFQRNPEFTALAAIANARRDNLQTMFAGARVVYGALSKAQATHGLQKHGRAVKKHASTLKTAAIGSGAGGPIDQARAMIVEAVGVDMPDLVAVITSQAVEELVKEMTPYVGLFTSSGKAAMAWKQVYEQARAELAWDTYTPAIHSGDPLEACAAVRVILLRNIARSTTQAGIHTTAVAAKVAGMAGDMGSGLTTTVIGLASGLASLAVELTQLGIDIREMRAGNRLLLTPGSIDKTVFLACPLIGSYLLTRSTSSNLLNFFVADIGLPGWMNRIEEFKKNGLDPIITVAADQITRSRIQIEGVGVSTDTAYTPVKGGGKTSLSFKNFKFQFNRLVRSKLPF